MTRLDKHKENRDADLKAAKDIITNMELDIQRLTQALDFIKKDGWYEDGAMEAIRKSSWNLANNSSNLESYRSGSIYQEKIIAQASKDGLK